MSNAFAPPAEPHYSRKRGDSYVMPVERQLELFSKGVREIRPSSLGFGRRTRETEAFMAKHDREERRDSGRPPFCRQGGEAFATCRLGGVGSDVGPRKQRQTWSSVDLRSKGWRG